MSIELISLRMATREVNYCHRVCDDAVAFATSAKDSKRARNLRNLKKAQEQLSAAMLRCQTSGVAYTDADLPRTSAVN